MLKEITDNSDAPIFDLVDRNALTGLLNDEFTQPLVWSADDRPADDGLYDSAQLLAGKYRVKISL